MAWSPKGEVPKDIPGRVRGISEDGRIVLVDYPSGASMMGADVFKTRAIDLATRRALAIGSPGLSRGSNGRYSLSVAKEDPRPLQGAPGFFLPFYEADDQAFISVDAMPNAREMVFGYHMWSATERRRYAGEALVSIAPDTYGKSITLADPLSGARSNEFLGEVWLSGHRLHRVELQATAKRRALYDVEYDFDHRRTSARLVSRLNWTGGGYGLNVTSGDRLGQAIATVVGPMGGQWLIGQGKRTRLPQGNWRIWLGHVVDGYGASLREWRNDRVRPLLPRYVVLRGSTNGRWLLVNRTRDRQVVLMYFSKRW